MNHAAKDFISFPTSRGYAVDRRRLEPSPTTASQPMRKYTLQWLDSEGEICHRLCSAPALPIFENAFNAFAQGSIVQTSAGPVAVEDLIPGMMLETADGSTLPIRWIGAMTLLPMQGSETHTPPALYRVTDGCLGPTTGMPDLILGAGARLSRRGYTDRSITTLSEIADVVDGNTIVQITPRSPIQLFHIALDSHRLLQVNGIAMESYLPDPDTKYAMSAEMMREFVALFPHINHLADFGTMNFRR